MITLKDQEIIHVQPCCIKLLQNCSSFTINKKVHNKRQVRCTCTSISCSTSLNAQLVFQIKISFQHITLTTLTWIGHSVHLF